MKQYRLTILSLVSLILLSTASLSLSLAWYASSSNLRIEAFEISVRDERSLKVSTSTDISTFTSSLTDSDLNEPFLFVPVTSMYSSLFVERKDPNPVFYEEYSPVQTGPLPHTPNVATSGFFNQTFYLLSDDDVYVTLDKEKTFLKADKEKNLSAAKEHYSQAEANSKASEMDNLIFSMRASILVPEEEHYSYTILDLNHNGDTYYGGRLDMDDDGYYDTYLDEEGNPYERVYGDIINRENIVYDSPLDSDIVPEGTLTSFLAKSKAGTYIYDEEKSLANGVSYRKEDVLTMDTLETLTIPVKKDTPTPIVLSLYLEAWDRDCVNSTMGASFLSSFSFKIAKEATDL